MTSDGDRDIMDPADAVFWAANYLCRNGAGRGAEAMARAIWHYNHADWYVQLVLKLAGQYAERDPRAASSADPARGSRCGQAGGAGRRCSPEPSMPPMPLSASPSSLGTIQTLLASPCAICGSVWRYW